LPPDALGLDQDAGELGAVEQQIVRPFQFEFQSVRRRGGADGVPHRQRHHKAQFGADALPVPHRSASRLA
jgi:hypothetical protein